MSGSPETAIDRAATSSSGAADAPLPFRSSVWADVLAHSPPELRPRTFGGRAWLFLKVFVQSSGFHAVLDYRISHLLYTRLGLPGRLLAGLIFRFGRHWHLCSIAPSARLGGGLILPHPQGIVVGAHVRMGPRGWIFQNVTLGGAPGREGMPEVGSDARIYAGAVLTGPIRVGDHVTVGANAVVAEDVPPHSLVRAPKAVATPLPGSVDAEP